MKEGDGIQRRWLESLVAIHSGKYSILEVFGVFRGF
jgi:hypothetical protein